MFKLFLFLVVFLLLTMAVSSQNFNPYEPIPYVKVKHPEWAQKAVIYQINTRQFTKEGTFRAAENHLPRLKSLGVDISEETSDFQKVLSQEPVELRQRVNSEISKFSRSSKQFLRNNLPFVVKPLKKLLDRGNPNKPVMIRGIENGFNNALEAACFLGKSVAQGKMLRGAQ